MEEVVEVAEATARVVPIITEAIGKHNTMMIKKVGDTDTRVRLCIAQMCQT
jgi:hypothetical protein